MSRPIRLLLVLTLLLLPTLLQADAPAGPQTEGICLGPWECMNWCFDRGCLTTTGCDPANDGCFCANCGY